jgi:hypothetical protein
VLGGNRNRMYAGPVTWVSASHRKVGADRYQPKEKDLAPTIGCEEQCLKAGLTLFSLTTPEG